MHWRKINRFWATFLFVSNTAISDYLGADRIRLWLQRMMMDDGNNHDMTWQHDMTWHDMTWQHVNVWWMMATIMTWQQKWALIEARFWEGQWEYLKYAICLSVMKIKVCIKFRLSQSEVEEISRHFGFQTCLLETFKGIWGNLEEFGGIWRNLEEFGGIWRYLEELGGILARNF